MNSTVLMALLAVLMVLIACGVVVAIAVDRAARADAWRKIAEERRWLWEHRYDDKR